MNSCYQLIITVIISKKMSAFFLVQQRWNTKCPKLGKISLAETLSNVTNSSILENPQFGCCGYCDNFCDWWI